MFNIFEDLDRPSQTIDNQWEAMISSNCRAELDDDYFSLFESQSYGLMKEVNVEVEDKGDQLFIDNAELYQLAQLDIESVGTGILSTQPIMALLSSDTLELHQRRGQKKWGAEEDLRLSELHCKYNGDWKAIAKCMTGRNASQCSQRWRRKYPDIQTYTHWSEQEDQLLIQLVAKHGKLWSRIEIDFEHKIAKQIRDRFNNKLDSQINRNNWTKQEDELLYQSYQTMGPKWAKMSTIFKQRPANAIKNRFYSHVRRVYVGLTSPYFVITK